ncbi:MAG: hypothetical protein KC964_14040 [Candidatus Omnitrophica bacterium]|nr:hypothetical protein [Candidatus Omnitrophota bacterium]
MTFLNEIYATYRQVARFLTEMDATKGETHQLNSGRMSELNDYAYFILLFGQLEDFVNRKYEETIGQWDDPFEVTAFAHRVNLLYDQESEVTESILFYYDIRCDIAHGYAASGRLHKGIQISDVYEDIRVIVSGHA